jgi:phage FluMu protein Com
LAKAPNRALGTAHLKVHCPNDQCKYFAEDYNPAEWNALMK